jgi:hypothetical protein
MNAHEKKIIQGLYGKLHRITESSRYFEDLTRIATKEEREHRKMGARFTDGRAAYNAPLGITGEYFAVRAVLDGLTANYTAANYLYIRESSLMGAGIAHQYAARITAEVTPEEFAEFAALDYVKMIE